MRQFIVVVVLDGLDAGGCRRHGGRGTEPVQARVGVGGVQGRAARGRLVEGRGWQREAIVGDDEVEARGLAVAGRIDPRRADWPIHDGEEGVALQPSWAAR